MNNKEFLLNIITSAINVQSGDNLPTLAEIYGKAQELRNALVSIYPITDVEFENVKTVLARNILHRIGTSVTLRGVDSEHKSWYGTHNNDGYYWNRYKTYLRGIKLWGGEIVNRLNETTNDIMDDLGNPTDNDRPFQRRGLLLGDVQSGKTATYTAICNKAADAGYRVIIVLAGIMENLRVQTQERLDKEFVGMESRYALDITANNEIRNTPTGVGRIPPNDINKRIACFTSVVTDFRTNIVTACGLSLSTIQCPALFVVKKNRSILRNLCNWLVQNNATNGVIDLPLLLIDDEADNASVNTNTPESDPTAINGEIRRILNCFRQATYLGITATPFANIFINPESETDEGTRDLFPKDFLTVLPTPDLYIGAEKIFGSGDADNWELQNELHSRTEGIYSNTLIPILNDEQENFYFFRHTRNLQNNLTDIPPSMKKAIGYFILATAISDLRGDNQQHRSMLVNVSRFTVVQEKTQELISGFVSGIRSDLDNYAALDVNKAMQIETINYLYGIWKEYELSNIAGIEWSDFLREYIYSAARRIEIRSVNQRTGAKSLDYYNYPKGMRVIAVGGNSLSRGLTLEGLCVSYFYRNSMMYDTLLQMGRWFGYRLNYDDLFKIWIGEDAIDWYGYISDAVAEFKSELHKMARQNMTPREFGLKVRQAPGSLLITARNKMRSGINVSRPITLSGRMIETPRLRGDQESIENNEKLCRKFIRLISANANITYEFDKNTNSHIWRNVPKEHIINLVRDFRTHPWNLNFQPLALADYISERDTSLELWDVAIPQGSENQTVDIQLGNELYCPVKPEKRKLERDKNIRNLLRVGEHHVRVGVGGCSKIGLSKEEIKRLAEESRRSNDKITDRTYLTRDRKPIALIHILSNNSKTRQENDPDILFALGLGFPNTGVERYANYVVNSVELRNWVDGDIAEVEDDDDYSGIV